MNQLFESVNDLFESDKPIIEGYSLGDDKESFKVWDETGKKLKEIVDYLKDTCGVDFSNIDIEHSQDSIYYADFTLKGISEDAVNDPDLEHELYNNYIREYSFLANIQLENWGGPICIIGFDIDSAISNKYRLGTIIKEISEKVYSK